jgi:hypothetical protein
MAEEPRFDWPTIWRSIAIIVGIPAVIGFAAPPLLTLAFGQVNTGYAAGNELFNWGFWIIAWGLTFAQAAYFLRHVGDKIIDDMLVVAIISAFLLVIIKLTVAIIYLPISADGKILPLMTGIDAGGALLMVLVALIGARMNRY